MESSLVLFGMFASLIVLMLSGAGLAFVLGAIAFLATATLWGPSALIVTVLNTFETMTSEALMAIPLYVLMAAILQKSRIIDDLYTAMETWFGGVSGGLAIGTVVICTIMAAMTGVVGAAVAAMGILALPSMLSRGYHPPLALGAICAGGTLGILIPPSVVTIVYAITAQISIGQMFIAGIIPGLVLAVGYCSYIWVRVALNPKLAPKPVDETTIPLSQKVASLRHLALPALVILSVLGSIYAGIATPTEAAAVGVLGALLSAIFSGRLELSSLNAAATDTLRVTAMILWITLGAKAFISVFVATGGADSVLSFVESLDSSRYVVLLAMLLVLIFLGLFLDEIGIILLCVPVFVPIIKTLGFDPLWFGVLFMVTAQMAYITPPFGYTLFYLKGVLPDGIGIGQVYRGVIPFFLIQVVVLILFVAFPEIVTWLPEQAAARLK
ncbi:C4-dicarboxylate TRAP transporter large permease protein DctM (plasmid) [Sulfitobacter sp. DSM 110093]|uniref:TRAP transporter large permease n=1 Tax=Sulfitobacter sp. DSM 110093 TaxID=2883127 RepID=UPI001FABF667|nr:TRAP transporter large permease subunit [Sulfitobacter sp. DSM 110093]UOA33768.1 C4-dicarboxylate TRAP transporter large permease protein DctM [Sulfitobacter sp. DSM 110093]UOA34029.1 C4-dicarboxylate TRAP transporter large permease protein DctM [Sulfitobacter sp. DSM 110093]